MPCIHLFHFITVAATGETNRACQFVIQPPVAAKHGPEVFHVPLIQVADFDGDHLVDVLRVAREMYAIELFLGYENNSFRSRPEYFYDQGLSVDDRSYVRTLFSADLNHDQYVDLISQTFAGFSLDVSYGYGNGSFQDLTPILTVNFTYRMEVVVGDLNNDTYVDLVIALVIESEIIVHLGRQSGSFSVVPDHRMNVSTQPWTIALADFNADGILDLFYESGDSVFSILLGVGDGSFHLEKIRSTPQERIMQAITLVDLNKDGLADIVFLFYGQFDLQIMLNEGNGTFQHIAADHIRLSAMDCFQIGDLNNDHHLDIAVAEDSQNRDIRLYFGVGNGSFAASENNIVLNNAMVQCFQLGDFNGDDRLDLVTIARGNLVFVLNDC